LPLGPGYGTQFIDADSGGEQAEHDASVALAVEFLDQTDLAGKRARLDLDMGPDLDVALGLTKASGRITAVRRALGGAGRALRSDGSLVG
jgi:hypothetical protein